ncbi:MAG: hypothetical protein PHI28_18735 [Mangrovibacterium sp.]|nr:hypothetical protein [Mangrovibacterium sp.]
MQALLVTPKNKESGVFLKKLLSKLNDVKSIEVIDKDEKEISFATLSESSLEKEWNSTEDKIWDTWASEKLKKSKK